MMRVLTFGRYADLEAGGVERYVFELARAAAPEARFTNIVAGRGAPPHEHPFPGEMVHARTLFWLGAGVPFCPSMPAHALRLHRRERFDLVHLQFPADPMAHLALLALPRTVARVITWHADIVRQARLLRAYRPMLDSLVRSADAIVLPTPAHLSTSTQLGAASRERMRVVPYGFDLERFRSPPPLAAELRARAAGRFTVFALGRHVYYKGFDVLLHALARLPGARVVLGGRGPLTEELRALARELGLEDRVEFAGRIPEADLPAWYHACDAFCLPSTVPAEAFGIVQLEAMACGKPVVSSALGNGVNWANPDGVTGLSAPPGDAQALAAALERLRADPALGARLGEAGRRRALEELTAGAMARGTLEVFREAIARRRAARA